MAALAVDQFGTDEQRSSLLPGVADGSRVLTVALTETGTGPLAPTTEAADGALRGTKLLVPFGQQATHAVVPARVGQDIGLFLVDLAGDGVSQEVDQVSPHQAHPAQHRQAERLPPGLVHFPRGADGALQQGDGARVLRPVAGH